MKALIIGAGRMGTRHAQGILGVEAITEVCMVDISDSSLEIAKAQLSSQESAPRLKTAKVGVAEGQYDFVIISSTASERISTCKYALSFNPKYILIEKPLGQSFSEVEQLANFFKNKNVSVSVNLNTRMYDFMRELKKDLNTLPQFSGVKHINYNGGTIGIGANGIHYIDLLFYLLDACSAELTAGEIEPQLILSGRGLQFGDFGGWACIKFFDTRQQYIGRSLLSLSSTSTVFGGWEIIGTHGRIRINELEKERIDILRKTDSIMPLNRYAADYLPPVTYSIEAPFLGDLTQKWIESILNNGINLLPGIDESLKVHRILFDWLSLSTTFKEVFPIT
jgi:predicted dehydrogenase